MVWALRNVGNLPQYYTASQPRLCYLHLHGVGPLKGWYPTTILYGFKPRSLYLHLHDVGPPKRQYSTTTLHGVTTQKTST